MSSGPLLLAAAPLARSLACSVLLLANSYGGAVDITKQSFLRVMRSPSVVVWSSHVARPLVLLLLGGLLPFILVVRLCDHGAAVLGQEVVREGALLAADGGDDVLGLLLYLVRDEVDGAGASLPVVDPLLGAEVVGDVGEVAAALEIVFEELVAVGGEPVVVLLRGVSGGLDHLDLQVSSC